MSSLGGSTSNTTRAYGRRDVPFGVPAAVTDAEIVQLAGSFERAAQMKKLIEQTERLMDQGRQAEARAEMTTRPRCFPDDTDLGVLQVEPEEYAGEG